MSWCVECGGTGVFGPLAHNENIERCDDCCRFPGDLEAAGWVRDLIGGHVRFYFEADDVDYDEHRDEWPECCPIVTWDGNDLVGGCIAYATAPWIEEHADA
jgi:hypothetical protein